MQSSPPPSSGTRRVRGAHESKSASVRAAAAAPSKRQLSRWQRDQQQTHMLYIAIGILVAVVAVIFAAGLLYDRVVKANQVVATIGPDSITAQQLLDQVRPQAAQIDAQAKQYGGTGNQQIADYVDQQKRGLPDQVLNNMVDQHLIQQEADRRGITVTQAEVDDKLRQTVAAYQASQNPTPAPTPVPTDEASPTTDVNATPQAGLTSTTPAAVATPVTPTTPTPVPTLVDSDYAAALNTLLTTENLTESDVRTQLQQGLLQDKVQTAIGLEQVPDSQPQVHAQQIQVATQDQANALLTQLQGGADFATLAQQNSTNTATKGNGGDMGWFPKGVQSTQIDNAVFPLQAGQLTGVVQDSAGFHILQVLETDPNRAVPPDQLTTLRQKAYSTWLSNQRSSQNVQLNLDQSTKDWILSKLGVRP